MANQRVYLNSSEFLPADELILVKQTEIKKEETSASGLVISIKQESVTNRPSSGDVITIGNNVTKIKEGDFVFWPNTEGIDLEFDDGVFLLLREKSIVGTKKK